MTIARENSPSVAATTLRRANPSDALVLAQLRYQFRASIGEAVEQEDVFVARIQPWLQRCLVDPRWFVWVAEIAADAIVGHAYLHLIEKIPNPIVEAEHIGYITNVFVQPSHRGHGLGRKLVTLALDHCRERRDVANVVLWPTEASCGLYTSLGFTSPRTVLELNL